MTEQERRELDAWLAQYGCIKGYCEVLGYIPEFTENPNEFTTVKREIKRRGWSWYASCSPRHDGHLYHFSVESGNAPSSKPYSIIHTEAADTEELAGCLAFKAAVEAMGDEDTS